jgi:hypothetical protein
MSVRQIKQRMGALRGSLARNVLADPTSGARKGATDKATGGTGLFRGATGSGTSSGSLTPNVIATIESKSTLSY